MKQLRILLLVLLAVLLPVRGAMAVGMGCADGPGAHASASHDGAHDHGAGHHGTAGPDAAHPTADPGGAADGSAAGEHGAGTCQACASGCCVTPLASALPSLTGQPPAHRVDFPALSAPAPAFHSGGQDRPPRTL